MKENKKLINIRLTPKEKEQMESLADICGLSLSEYLRKRGLGYEPRPLLSDSFYLFYSKLCDLCNQQLTTETETALLALVNDIRRELILPRKQTRKEVVACLSGSRKNGWSTVDLCHLHRTAEALYRK